MVFIHDEKEIVLDINATPYRPATWISPEEPAEMEIVDATYPDGEAVSDDLVEHLMDEHYDEIFEQYANECDAHNEYMESLSWDERR